MSIRENISRVLFFGLLVAMLVAPITNIASSSKTASHNDAHAIACVVNGGNSNGGCGG